MGGWLKYHYRKTYPVQVGDIRIGRSCAKLHLLHGDNFLVDTNFGTVVSKLVLHYADGSTRDSTWWRGNNRSTGGFRCSSPGCPKDIFTRRPARNGPGPAAIRTSGNGSRNFSLVLYKTTFDNPQPEVKIPPWILSRPKPSRARFSSD